MLGRRHWPVRTDDGHSFELKVTGPADSRKAILFLPAMGVPARYYRPLAEALAEAGVLLARCELRGVGTSSLRPGRGTDFGYRHILESDLPAALRTLHERAEGVPVHLAGHSLGGQLALLYAAAGGIETRGAILIACASPYFECWSGMRRAQLRAAGCLLPTLAATMGYVPAKRFGLGGEREAAALMRDWSSSAQTGTYSLRRGPIDYEAALASYEGRVLSIAIQGDEMAQSRAVDFMLRKVPRAKSRRIDVELRETKRAGHFGWVQEPDTVSSAILSELEA